MEVISHITLRPISQSPSRADEVRYAAVCPPSMTITLPVMKSDAADAR